VKCVLTTFLAFVPRFLQPFTALPEGRAPQTLCSQISSSSTSRGPIVDVFMLMLGAPGPSALAPHGSRMGTGGGPTIDVFNFGGGHCRTLLPPPPGGPPSMSSTLVVATAGPAASTPQGVRHRRLQLRWWPLPGLPPAPPRGLYIDVFNLGGGRGRAYQ
jgi:hypothetical protein